MSELVETTVDIAAATDSFKQIGGLRYLVISKKNNVALLIKTALAYEFVPIIVGLLNIIDAALSEYLHFETLECCKEYLISMQIPLVGIEIMKESLSVKDFPFTQSIAVMPGNEGTGLNSRQKKCCDSFVYIPQYGNGTASLNVNVATTIVIHSYHVWSKCNA